MYELIPKTFANSDHEAMFLAADTWRLPFWDWAVKKPDWDVNDPESLQNKEPLVGPNVPYIITQEFVKVKTSTGQSASVANPMWKFLLPVNVKHPEKRVFGQYGIGTHRGKPVLPTL
jgi:tyrosinase